MQKDVVFGLQQGTSVLKQIHAEMGGVENVEKLMGENEEARHYQREISDMLAGQMSNQDEDEVEDELDALEAEINGGVTTGNEVVPATMPEAPTGEIDEADSERIQAKLRKARARVRAQEQGTAPAPEPMLA